MKINGNKIIAITFSKVNKDEYYLHVNKELFAHVWNTKAEVKEMVINMYKFINKHKDNDVIFEFGVSPEMTATINVFVKAYDSFNV